MAPLVGASDRALSVGLVLLGLFTKPAALLCSGAMAFAYFAMHQLLGLLPLQNKGEPAALYSWVFLLIATLGPGPFALDAVLRRLRPTHQVWTGGMGLPDRVGRWMFPGLSPRQIFNLGILCKLVGHCLTMVRPGPS